MVLRWCLFGLFGCVLSGAGMSAAAAAPAVILQGDQPSKLDEACILPGSDTPPGPQDPWLHVHLPHRWPATHPGYRGAMWYRFNVVLAHAPKGVWAVYLPRAVMNAQVWVNGLPMAYAGSMTEPVTRNWYVPSLVQVPANVWRDGENIIQIKVVSGYASRDGLAPISVGPLSQLEEPYKWRTLLQVDGTYFANIAMLALGVFMVIVWWRDPDLRAIGFQGAAAMLWGMGNAAWVAAHAFLPAAIWERGAFITMIWSALLMSLFFRRFAGRSSKRFDALVLLLIAATPVLSYFQFTVPGVALAFCVVYSVFMVCMVQSIYWLVRHRRRDREWFLGGCALLIPAAAHDLAFQVGVLPFDTIYLLPYISPIMMSCIFYVLAGDYGRSRRALNRLNGSLADTLAQRELALRESFERLAELERAQAVSAERSRILQDMHDGVGAHLTSALRQLQSPPGHPVDVGLVTQTLRDSLDQLKLSIDALSLPPGDVVGLLASLRYRITPRLKASGLELVWDVTDLPPWPQGHAPALRQLQYILFEGLSNVLQHSGATRLTLSAKDGGDHLQVSLIDNGRGWSREGEGQGLQTMRGRARVIGARIEFLTTPEGGAELRVILPMQRDGRLDLSSAA
jgi:signal transduction histidine kinase